MDFTNKLTYLAAVADWKLRYAEHSLKTRVLREDVKNADRAYAKDKSYTPYETLILANSDKYYHRKEANVLLQERADSKLLAKKQYELTR